MSDEQNTTAVEEYDYSKFDASSGYSLEQWGAMADLAAAGRRLKQTLPGGDKLQIWEAIGVAQYAALQGANPWRGEIYGYSDKHGFHLVEGYKLLVRWAKAKCDYSEWYEPMAEDKLPGTGDIGYTVHILRDDKHDLLDKLLKHGLDVDRVMDIVTTKAGGVVRKGDQSDYPPAGWTWHDVAKKRALKNGLNRSHGAPSAAEIARETWTVDGVETQPQDWAGTATMPTQDRELEAKYKAQARERKEKRDDSAEAGKAVADLFGDEAGGEYANGVVEHETPPDPTVEPHEWTLAESDDLCAWGRERTLDADTLMTALGAERLTEYPGDLAQAKDAITKWIAEQVDGAQAQAEMPLEAEVPA